MYKISQVLTEKGIRCVELVRRVPGTSGPVKTGKYAAIGRGFRALNAIKAFSGLIPAGLEIRVS